MDRGERADSCAESTLKKSIRSGCVEQWALPISGAACLLSVRRLVALTMVFLTGKELRFRDDAPHLHEIVSARQREHDSISMIQAKIQSGGLGSGCSPESLAQDCLNRSKRPLPSLIDFLTHRSLERFTDMTWSCEAQANSPTAVLRR